MFKRDIYNQLQDWSERSDRKPLVLRGARQVGKTTALLFIDEIQNVPKAVALLKYFYEDMPDLFVIAAGSRLQSLLKE